jgi:Caspase domain
MTSIAFLIANAKYERQDDLPCCLEDLAAVKALIESIGQHNDVKAMADVNANHMRDEIRKTLEANEKIEEIFFYFSGHGTQIGKEFYYCGTTFDNERPNQTGLSHSQLHDMFRSAEPDLLVKVVDSCASGTLLVKDDRDPLPAKKDGFRNVIQLSSCLDEQSSFGGDPLSSFTRSFCVACLTKADGPIYYSDVINTLRDAYLENEDQTPHFVSQGTGRELLVKDALKLTSFRDVFDRRWSGKSVTVENTETVDGTANEIETPRLSLKQLLMESEEKMADPDVAKDFIDSLFDGVLKRYSAGEFAEFFEIETKSYDDFRDTLPHDFMTRILSKEPRVDRFVTAEITRVQAKKRQNLWENAISNAMMSLSSDWTERFDLELNCKLDRAQICITLTPKYRQLQQIKLVLTCAPSLERCYVFELASQHPRTDWDGFAHEGKEIVKRWYKMDWTQTTEFVVEKICVALENAVKSHVEKVAVRLKEPDA